MIDRILDQCPVCASGPLSSGMAIRDHEYGVQYRARYDACTACGSLCQNPMPDERTLSGFYPPRYHSMTNEGALNRVRNLMRVRRLRSLLPKRPARILDFGCGNGVFIQSAAESMPDCLFWGYEIRAEPSRKQLGERVTVLYGSVEYLLSELQECDLITMNHVIEHLPDPFDTISRVCARLSKGGVIEGQTPAAGSLEHRIFGSRWSGYHAPRHTVIFSRAGLGLFLSRAGLGQVKTAPAFNPAGLGVSLASVRPGRSNGIERKGLGWLFWLGLAGSLAPLDLFLGAPGVVNFSGIKR